MVSAVMLSGVTSRESIPGIPARLADGADERAISVGISTALFGLSGSWRIHRGTNLCLSGDQMTVTTQHPYRLAAPRAVKRFEQGCKEAYTLRTLPGVAFGESTHR